MKKMLTIALIPAVLVVSGVVAFVVNSLRQVGQISSVGIIGSADGPTSILIAGNPFFMIAAGAITIFIAAFTFVAVVVRRVRK